MEKSRFNSAMLFPLLAILIIIAYGGGLGVTFMLLNHYLTEWSVVILGVALVVGVPAVAALLQRRLESS